MVLKSVTMSRDNLTKNAGAPETEITPEMVEAGLAYLEERGVNSLTSMTAYPEFVVGFIQAINRARELPSIPSSAASP